MARLRQDSAKADEIGQRIAQARHEAGGMSQRELADLIGVSERSVQAYETGQVIPWRYMSALEKALGKSTAWLLHGEEATSARDGQLDEIREMLIGIQADLAALSSQVDRNTKTIRSLRQQADKA